MADPSAHAPTKGADPGADPRVGPPFCRYRKLINLDVPVDSANKRNRVGDALKKKI